LSHFPHGQQQQNWRKAYVKAITGAVTAGGLIRITATAHGFTSNQRVNIAGVGGTVEANGSNWAITVITANTFDLVGSVFVNAYTSGGTATRASS
jgi:hypothetical protein